MANIRTGLNGCRFLLCYNGVDILLKIIRLQQNLLFQTKQAKRVKNDSKPIPGANKAVKSREDGVTRYVAGYTVFLCGELFWEL